MLCRTDSVVRFMKSKMISGAKSGAGGHFYLKDKTDRKGNNGAILTLSKIIKHTMPSASEAETAALFLNCKATIPLRIALEEMGHPHPKTPVITDNLSAEGLINNTMIPKEPRLMIRGSTG